MSPLEFAEIIVLISSLSHAFRFMKKKPKWFTHKETMTAFYRDLLDEFIIRNVSME